MAQSPYPPKICKSNKWARQKCTNISALSRECRTKGCFNKIKSLTNVNKTNFKTIVRAKNACNTCRGFLKLTTLQKKKKKKKKKKNKKVSERDLIIK